MFYLRSHIAKRNTVDTDTTQAEARQVTLSCGRSSRLQRACVRAATDKKPTNGNGASVDAPSTISTGNKYGVVAPASRMINPGVHQERRGDANISTPARGVGCVQAWERTAQLRRFSQETAPRAAGFSAQNTWCVTHHRTVAYPLTLRIDIRFTQSVIYVGPATLRLHDFAPPLPSAPLLCRHM